MHSNKKITRIMIAVAFVVWGVFAVAVVAGDLDLDAIRARVAEQEARRKDMEAKIQASDTTTPEALVRPESGMKVTVGGKVSTRYTYENYTISGGDK